MACESTLVCLTLSVLCPRSSSGLGPGSCPSTHRRVLWMSHYVYIYTHTSTLTYVLLNNSTIGEHRKSILMETRKISTRFVPPYLYFLESKFEKYTHIYKNIYTYIHMGGQLLLIIFDNERLSIKYRFHVDYINHCILLESRCEL